MKTDQELCLAGICCDCGAPIKEMTVEEINEAKDDLGLEDDDDFGDICQSCMDKYTGSTARTNQNPKISYNDFGKICSDMTTMSLETQAIKARDIEIDNPGFFEFWWFSYILNIPIGKENKYGDAGYVYFLQDDQNKNIKIGFTSKTPSMRVGQFRLMNSSPSTILLSIPAPLSMELSLHRAFKKFRVHGEWFSPSPEILAFIENPCAESELPGQQITFTGHAQSTRGVPCLSK